MCLICSVLWISVCPLLRLLEPCIQRWARPTVKSVILGTIADLTQGRSILVLENALLRQQVIVLSHETKRLPLTNRDRRLLVLLARLLPYSKGFIMPILATPA